MFKTLIILKNRSLYLKTWRHLSALEFYLRGSQSVVQGSLRNFKTLFAFHSLLSEVPRDCMTCDIAADGIQKRI